MINTYNETSLHKQIKEIYAKKFNGKTEIEIEKYICDIFSSEKDPTIIEIQTSNLSKITNKIEKLCKNYKVKLVYPLATVTIIQKQDENKKILSKRKSPKKKNIYSIFGELFTLYKLFENPNFSLIVLPIQQIVTKTVFTEPVQTINKSRRYKKNWLITDKVLLKYDDEIILNSKIDLFNLIPKEIPEGLAGQYRLRRCMKSRRVGVTPSMHCSLGLAMYSQVTSPLRRYMDLIAHQQLRAFIDNKKLISKDEVLERISCGDAGINAAVKADRESCLHWKLVFLTQNPDWQGKAIAVEKKQKQTVFLIPELAMETILNNDKDYELNEEITVKVGKISIPELSVDFIKIL